ncbi:MAG: DNA-processing protein DprA [Thermocrispum sp.]
MLDETEARYHRTVSAAELERSEADLGARLVTPEDHEWPAWPLLALTVAGDRGVKGMTAPLALWVRGGGRLDQAVERAVTVVGSRAASGYGEHIASEWAYGLASEQVAVFSGAAYGIDAAAHRGALAAGGVTAAVLGCALDAGYPAGHDLLLRKVAERGLVLSEYAPGTPPARHRFLVRNRLLAALSAATVVVEAGLRSGARNTANTARALGRPVMAAPGPITSRNSAGCHELIRAQHATLVTSSGEVMELAGSLGADLDARASTTPRATDGLSGDALRVHEALQPDVGKSVERLSEESGVPSRRVRAVLPVLEVDGFSQRCESGWLLPRESRAASGLSRSD